MKRLLVLFLLIAIVVGGIYAWMELRPRPENLLGLSLRQLSKATVLPIQATLQWERADETQRHFSFGGRVSFSGMLDLRDLASIRANGVLGYGSSSNESDLETANVVLFDDKFAFQEKRFKEDRSNWLRSLTSSEQKDEHAWYVINRVRLFSEAGYSKAVAKGSDQGIREVIKKTNLKKIASVASSTEMIYGGREYMSIGTRLKEDALFSFMLGLIESWNKGKPMDTDIVWAKELAHNAAKGEWMVLVDESAGDVIGITGRWYVYDEQERIIGRGSVSMTFNANSFVLNKVPRNSADITERLFSEKKGALPASDDRKRLPESEGVDSVEAGTQTP